MWKCRYKGCNEEKETEVASEVHRLFHELKNVKIGLKNIEISIENLNVDEE